MSSNSLKVDDSEKIQLKKSISLFSACAIIVGTIIGSGIFVIPSGIVNYSGSFSVAILVWLLSGVIALIGAYSYCELGTMIKTAGGDYAYINEAYGSLYSFLYTWMMVFITIPSYNAFSAYTIGEYLVKMFSPNCNDSDDKNALSIKLVSVAILCKVLSLKRLSYEYF